MTQLRPVAKSETPRPRFGNQTCDRANRVQYSANRSMKAFAISIVTSCVFNEYYIGSMNWTYMSGHGW